MSKFLLVVVLTLLPFLAALVVSSQGWDFVTEIRGNVGLGVVLTSVIALYYVGVAWLVGGLKALPYLLGMAILALVFLPVRQDIAVISTITADEDILWIERSTVGEYVRVFHAEDGFLLQPQQLLELDETVYEAYLERDNGSVFLVHRVTADDDYQRQPLSVQ